MEKPFLLIHRIGKQIHLNYFKNQGEVERWIQTFWQAVGGTFEVFQRLQMPNLPPRSEEPTS